MTNATIMALHGLRDLSMFKWYAIPLLAIVSYIYAREIKEARTTGNWNAVLAGLTVLGADFFNETWNSWVMYLTNRSAFWTTPGDTALRVMVGWNIEIIFMFSILGLIYYHTLSPTTKERILGISEKWFWAIVFSAFCVFVEVLLNKGGHLIWEYPFWNRSFKGVWLIFLLGYLPFFALAILVISLKNMKTKLLTVGVIYLVPALMNIVALGFLKWKY